MFSFFIRRQLESEQRVNRQLFQKLSSAIGTCARMAAQGSAS